MKPLNELIREARKEKQLSQERLSEMVGTTNQWISRIEIGNDIPSYELTVRLYTELHPKQPLIEWLMSWLAAGKDLEDTSKVLVQNTVEETMIKLDYQNAAQQRDMRRSLENFPQAFYPLTIVCGDRRELSPSTRGDIYAYSVAITDLMFLPKLGLDPSVRIFSDKLFVLMDEDSLKRKFGQTNLFVIGSPAVNFVARILNNQSIFQFDPAADIAAWEKWDKFVKSNKLLNDRRYVRVLWEMVHSGKPIMIQDFLDSGLPEAELSELMISAEQLLEIGSPKDLMNKFRKPGILDPADDRVQAQTTRFDNDFASISLAPNCFAQEADYVVIIAAGIHGPGTAHAVRALAHDGISFQDHPFGGVIEVEMDTYSKDWPTRFETAGYRWQTKPYTPEKLLMNVQQAHAQPLAQRQGACARLEDKILVERIQFIERLSKGMVK